MNNTNPTNPSDDELLDQLTSELRSQPVPPMPADLQDWSPAKTVAAKSSGFATWLIVGAVAASICIAVAITCWRLWSVPEKGELIVEESPTVDIEELADQIEVSPVSLDNELAAIEQGLNEIDQEITQLKQQAQLLDARRRASELIDTFTQAVPANHF